jgi:tetratricopeptide (TPR) repeat protein
LPDYLADIIISSMKKIVLCIFTALLLTSLHTQAQNPKRFFKAGEDFFLAGNYQDAVEQFTRAIDLQPDYDKAYLARADAYEKLGMINEAAADYDRATTFLDKKEEVFFHAGRLYYALAEYDKALERLDKSITLKRNYLEPYQVKAKVLLAQERYEEALEIAHIALTLKETTDNFYLHGIVNEKMGNLEAAESDFVNAIAEDHRHVPSLLALADIRLRLGKTDFALQHANRAIQFDNDNQQAYVIRSKVYVRKLDYPNAIDDVSKAIMLNPEDTNMYFLRGVYYQDFTQHANAVGDFTKVLMLQPENADALYKRAWSYEQVGDYRSAIKDYEKLVSLSEFDGRAQKLLKEANVRLFELYRESNKPDLVILDPEPRDKQLLQYPKDSKVVSLKGRILDESDIKSLKIDGIAYPVEETDEGWEFLAALDIQDRDELYIQITDVYDNVSTLRYSINLTEVNAPYITIIAPYASDNGEIFLDSNDPEIYVEGKIQDESLIQTIMINGVLASYYPEELNPRFTASLNVLNQNRIVVTAEDIYGNTIEQEFYLNRDAAMMSDNNPMGKTWAIFIENSSYQSFSSLAGPPRDVMLMRTALAKYQVHNIIHKKDMTKSEMERFFSIELRDLVRSNRVNSILIWYAGHGNFINETGYWIPVDAHRNDEFTYFNINALKASLQSYSNYVTHTLVVTDACESGPSFYQAMRSEPVERSCDDWEATTFKSSQVFSSAGYELAADNSQFTRTFANSLANNPNACLPIENIVKKVTSAVEQSHQQKPEFGKIDGLEDEDGTFFFISRDY